MSALSVEILPERDLIEATRDGDRRAFEELYARYQERIAAFIHSRVRDHGRAEDVAQEVFISALRRLRASSQEIAFKPWIYEIAKNACIDEYRRSVRGREVPLDDGGEGPPAARLLSTAPTPPAAVEAKERLSDLRGAFGVLSENHHQLIVMREFEGLSYDEIGARMGMSRQMVESALFRARRKLTEEYEELASGRRCEQIQTAVTAGRAMSASSLGLRERRRFARHLAHCQPCRMHAQLAGVDESLLATRRSLGAKIAGLLPFPLVLRWPWAGRRARAAVAEVGAHPEALQTLHRASEPAAATSLGGAAVAAAVLALAGTGAVVAPDASRGQVAPAVHAHAVPAAGHVRTVRPSAPAAVTPVVPPALSARLQAAGAAQKSGRNAVSAGHRAARRHHASGTGPAAGAPQAPSVSPASGNAAGASGTRRHGLPIHAGRPAAPGTVVRSTGSSLSNTISSVSGLATKLTAGLPISSTASNLGSALAAGTQSATDTLGRAADGAGAAADGAVTAAGDTAAAATAPVAATLTGATGALRGVAHGLTGH